jgi:hypothetical protein
VSPASEFAQARGRVRAYVEAETKARRRTHNRADTCAVAYVTDSDLSRAHPLRLSDLRTLLDGTEATR